MQKHLWITLTLLVGLCVAGSGHAAVTQAAQGLSFGAVPVVSVKAARLEHFAQKESETYQQAGLLKKMHKKHKKIIKKTHDVHTKPLKKHISVHNRMKNNIRKHRNPFNKKRNNGGQPTSDGPGAGDTKRGHHGKAQNRM